MLALDTYGLEVFTPDGHKDIYTVDLYRTSPQYKCLQAGHIFGWTPLFGGSGHLLDVWTPLFSPDPYPTPPFPPQPPTLSPYVLNGKYTVPEWDCTCSYPTVGPRHGRASFKLLVGGAQA